MRRRVFTSVRRRERVHVRTSATASLTRLATSVVLDLTMHRADVLHMTIVMMENMLHMTAMLAVRLVADMLHNTRVVMHNMTAMLALGAATALGVNRLGFRVNVLGVGAGLGAVMEVFHGLVLAVLGRLRAATSLAVLNMLHRLMLHMGMEIATVSMMHTSLHGDLLSGVLTVGVEIERLGVLNDNRRRAGATRRSRACQHIHLNVLRAADIQPFRNRRGRRRNRNLADARHSNARRKLIRVRGGDTNAERRAIRESALGAGASQVFLIEEPMAAAIGSGLPVSEAAGSMVVDIGGGTTEVGMMSLGGMVYKGSVRVGGDKFDEAITNYIRRNYGMLIGEQTAELIKKTIGSAFPGAEVREMEVKGRNLSEGIPRSFTVTSNEILEALTDPLNQIVTAVKAALEQIPPELASDIAERGMMLTGGGALLRDLDRLLLEETGLPIHVAEDPLTCVARGCGIALERMDKLGGVFSQE